MNDKESTIRSICLSDIEIFGKKYVEIANYKKILLINDEEIIVQSYKYNIKIKGKRLKIQDFSKSGMTIYGNIEGVILNE